MIPVAKIIEQIRIDEQDINEVKFSDWDIENAMNKALRLMANQFAMMNTDFCEKEVDAPLTEMVDGGFPLPRDYISVISVVASTSNVGYKLHPTIHTKNTMEPDEYMITDGKLYAKMDVVLRYKAMLPEVHSGDIINVPFSFFDIIEAVTRLVLNNEPRDTLLAEITALSKAVVPSRRYATARTSMPFDV